MGITNKQVNNSFLAMNKELWNFYITGQEGILMRESREAEEKENSLIKQYGITVCMIAEGGGPSAGEIPIYSWRDWSTRDLYNLIEKVKDAQDLPTNSTN